MSEWNYIHANFHRERETETETERESCRRRAVYNDVQFQRRCIGIRHLKGPGQRTTTQAF